MYILGIVVSLLFVVIDQVTKLMAVTFLKPIDSIVVIDGFLNFTFVENRGAAFGIMQGRRWLFVILTVVVVGLMSYYYVKLPKTKVYNVVRFSLTLIIAGAIGNCIDRLFRGYVVDFLHITFINFPVFNIADIFVVTGTVLLVIMLLFFIKDDEGRKEVEPIKSI